MQDGSADTISRRQTGHPFSVRGWTYDWTWLCHSIVYCGG